MSDFDQELSRRLESLREQGLYRELRRVETPQSAHIVVDGQRLLNFSSNDYLGLANHPALKEAAQKAVETYGAGAGASRLICGSLTPYHELEEELAAFKGTESALSFSTGYATALGTITALLEHADVVVLDKLVHASIVDAARLSGANLRVFPHNDLERLEEILKWADGKRSLPGAVKSGARIPRTLIVTESVFSMDGDFAPLKEIVEAKDRHGVWLMVDEAHATGLYGQHHRGWAEACGIADRVEIQMGTLGKAVGAAGGYIAGSRKLVELLINRARSFIYSTAPVPAAAAAARAGLRVIQSAEGANRLAQLWERVRQIKSALGNASWILPKGESAIIPLIIGDTEKALQFASELRKLGIYIPAIRYPTVARNQARLRLTMTATHTEEDVSELLNALTKCVNIHTHHD